MDTTIPEMPSDPPAQDPCMAEREALELWEEAARRTAEQAAAAAKAAVEAHLKPYLDVLRQRLANCETKHGLNKDPQEL